MLNKMINPVFLIALCAMFACSTPVKQNENRTIASIQSEEGPNQEALNAELNEIWSRAAPVFLEAIQNKLAGGEFVEANKKDGLTIHDVYDAKINFSNPPGFEHFSDEKIALAIPLEGTWSAEFRIKFTYRTKVLGIDSSVSDTAKVRISHIRFSQVLQMDHSLWPHVRIKKTKRPEIKFHVSLGAKKVKNWLVLKSITPFINIFANGALEKVFEKKIKESGFVAGFPEQIPGASGKLLSVDTHYDQKKLEGIVTRVEEKIRKDHMPYGILYPVHMDQDAFDSWQDAYAEGGPGIQGNVVGYTGFADAPIWTGHYLASQALRWAVTKDLAAADNARHALTGIGRLIDVNGGSGLLARSAFPADSPQGKLLENQGKVFRRAVLEDGREWVSFQNQGITRDQNLGIILGLATAYEFMGADLPDVAETIKFRATQLIDYYLKNKWVIEEDRRELGDKNPLTPWVPLSLQKQGIMAFAKKLDPIKYGPYYDKIADEVDKAWFSEWFTDNDPLSKYYKFNLGHVSLFLYHLGEKDPVRRAHVKRAVEIAEKFVGNHLNPHFDMIRSLYLGHEKKQEYAVTIRESIFQFVSTGHRKVSPTVLDFSDVEFVKWKMYFPDNKFVEIPARPLDVARREYAPVFQWERSPFKPGNQDASGASFERPGIDLTLPYWMARYLKILD